jgi:Flp pilus assembly pilin Flp
MVALLYPLRKVRSVTETSEHIQFLGWQPTPGELVINTIWPLVIALLMALLIEPLRRWLSRIWSSLSDYLSSLSDGRRIKRINALERKVKNLKEYDHRKLLILFARRIASLIVLFGFLIFISILAVRADLIGGGILAAKRWELTPLSSSQYGFYGFIHGIISVLVISTVAVASITFQEIVDFSNPPKAIKRLEERIDALRAKST